MVERKRTGDETRSQIQRTAVELFTARGYDATSMREIAEGVGITKASLYYHFAGKDDIVRSVMRGRGDEAAELADWLRVQEAAPDLLARAVLRWVDSFSAEKLRGIRFVNANVALTRSMRAESGPLREGLEAVVDLLVDLPLGSGGDAVGDAAERRLLVRMALLSINAAVAAAAGTNARDAAIVAAARVSAEALVARLS